MKIFKSKNNNNEFPAFMYTETYFGLQGTKESVRNIGSLNAMGKLGWEMMYVSPTKNPNVVSIIWKIRSSAPGVDEKLNM